MHVSIEAIADAGLLCRLVGYVAQRDLAPPAMTVAIAGDAMTVALHFVEANTVEVGQIAEKMGRCIGVSTIAIDGVPLAEAMLA